MVAFRPVLRTAAKVTPVALEVGRQVDRQLRPHVLAYRLARDVDGYVGRWTADGATHWVVFARPDAAAPVRVFPPVSDAEVAALAVAIDRAGLRHHTSLPEARARDASQRLAGVTRAFGDRALRRGGGRDGGRRLRGDAEDDPPATGTTGEPTSGG